MEVIDHYNYTKEHEWISVEDGIGLVGITDYAQSALGDITFIELPVEDDDVEQFGQFASIESVKAASDIYSPVAGKVTAVNGELEEDPGIINKSPYEKGWIMQIEIADNEELSNLLTADEYRKYLVSIG